MVRIKCKGSKFPVPRCLLPLPPPPSPPPLPHPLQSALDASSRGGLDFQAEPQLGLRVLIHLRELPHNLCRLRASPSSRPPPPAAQSLLHAGSGSPKGDGILYHAHDHHQDAPHRGYFLLPGGATTSAFLPPAPSPAKEAIRAGPGGCPPNAGFLRFSASRPQSSARILS